MHSHILAYLCSESGSLIQLKTDSVLQNFKSYNVLLFYSQESKNLYNWIGKKAKSELIQKIENAESLILSMHPEMAVLSRITVREQDKEDLYRMLDDIGISIQNYKERIRLWREFEISIYSDIQKLRIEENNHLMLSKLDKAIETANQIVDLAKLIHDYDIVEEKHKFIINLTEKLKQKSKKDAILSEIDQLVPKLKNCILVEEVEDAVSLYNQITIMYKTINEDPSNEHQKIINEYKNFYTNWERNL